jgi:hypothetical protein
MLPSRDIFPIGCWWIKHMFTYSLITWWTCGSVLLCISSNSNITVICEKGFVLRYDFRGFFLVYTQSETAECWSNSDYVCGQWPNCFSKCHTIYEGCDGFTFISSIYCLLPIFQTVSTLVCLKQHITVVLMFIPLPTDDFELFSCTSWSFVYFFWGGEYLFNFFDHFKIRSLYLLLNCKISSCWILAFYQVYNYK